MGIEVSGQEETHEPTVLPLRKVAEARGYLDQFTALWFDARSQMRVDFDQVANAFTRRVQFVARVSGDVDTSRMEQLLRHCAMDARTALDNLIYTIGSREGLRELDHLAFPIIHQPQSWLARSEEAPCRAGNGGGRPSSGRPTV